MLYSSDPGLPANDAHARRSGPDRSGNRAGLLRFAHRDATGEIAAPVVEALMFGGLGSGHYAFISHGRPLKIVGKN